MTSPSFTVTPSPVISKPAVNTANTTPSVIKPSPSFMGTVGQGLNASQTAAAYQALARASQPLPTSSSATGSGIVSAAKSVGGGLNSLASGLFGGLSSPSMASTEGGGGTPSTGTQGTAPTTYGTSANPAGTQSSPPSLASNQSFTTVGGKTGIETSQFGTNIPKGQTSLPPPDTTQADANAKVQDAGKQAASDRQAKIADVVGQINALQTQLVQEQAKAQASVYDPESDSNIQSLQSQQKALQDSLASLQTPTPEEQLAQQQLDALTAEQAQVNAGLTQKTTDINKEPIAQGYLTGWGNTFNKDATAKLQTIGSLQQPLQTQLARLAATRQSAIDVKKEQIANAKDAVTQAYNTYNTRNTQQRSDVATARTQAEADRKFNEDVREFGLNYAQKAKENAQKGITDAELAQAINKQIATPEFKKLTDSQKKDYILSQGGDPSKFTY